MKRLALITAAAMAFTSSLTASTLTPSQALAAALGRTQSSKLKAPASDMKLSYTALDSSATAPRIYVFTPRGDKPGYLVVAADDAVTPLLGFSDEGSFDPNNIPPAMKWWLESRSQQIAAASEAQANGTLKVQAPKKKQVYDRPEYRPLITCKWNQDAPFNNQCPTLTNSTETARAATGCVATAISQLMYYHKYPTRGIGTKSYSYTYNGTTYNESMTLSSTTFDWANMIDDYNGTYTTTQANAVAELMHAVGVVAEMSYGIEGSGAVTMKAVAGMIQYFNYDKGIEMIEEYIYSHDDLVDILTNEFAEGRPVIVSAHTVNNEGHCFLTDGYRPMDVTDGYPAGDFFHINWGWGGSSDGYFLLSSLDPGDQGIGGSASNLAFNYDQIFYIGVQPAKSGSTTKPLMHIDSNMFCTSASNGSTPLTSITLKSNSTTLYFQGGFYSFALGTVTYDLGLAIIPTDDSDNEPMIYTYATNRRWNQFYGVNQMSMIGVTASTLEAGEYDIVPIYRQSGTEEWQEMYGSSGSIVHYTHLKVTKSSTSAVWKFSSAANSTVRPIATLQAVSCLDKAFDDDKYYQGKAYNLSYKFKGSDFWAYPVYLAITDANVTTIYTLSNMVSMVLVPDNAYTAETTFQISIPSNLAPGSYKLVPIYENGGYYTMTIQTPITVEESPANGSAVVVAMSSMGWTTQPAATTNYSNPAVIDSKYGGISIDIQCTKGPWSDNITMRYYEASSSGTLSYKGQNERYVFFNAAGERKLVTFDATSAGLDVDDTSKAPTSSQILPPAPDPSGFVLIDESDNQQSDTDSESAEPQVDMALSTKVYAAAPFSSSGTRLAYRYYFVLRDILPTGVEDINIESEANTPVRYFNLQGMPVSEPAKGQLVIRSQGAKTEKIIF